MEYSLWDVETNRYLGRFAEEKDALALVRKLVNHYGSSYADYLDLGPADGTGEETTPLSGAALLARVNEVLEPPQGERRGLLVWKRVGSSIEPIAAAAGRTLKRLTAPGQQRTPGH